MTLNNAQRDGIRALREAAQELAQKIEAEREDIDRAGGTPLRRVDMILQCRFPVGPWDRPALNGVIAWADSELRDRPAHHAPALRRLLDDATALLRWVDGAL